MKYKMKYTTNNPHLIARPAFIAKYPAITEFKLEELIRRVNTNGLGASGALHYHGKGKRMLHIDEAKFFNWAMIRAMKCDSHELQLWKLHRFLKRTAGKGKSAQIRVENAIDVDLHYYF